ncbi:MAG: hypothetical protein ABSG05_00525 [Candidatus Pacearchaeota archaeon]|jgi:hypothetical protein
MTESHYSEAERRDFSNIIEATEKCYAAQVKQGYWWYTNCTKDELEKVKQKVVADGLEFIVGNTAFENLIKGKTMKGKCAVLVRKKRRESRYP